jgi:hypothetical protein
MMALVTFTHSIVFSGHRCTCLGISQGIGQGLLHEGSRLIGSATNGPLFLPSTGYPDLEEGKAGGDEYE